MNVLFAAQVEGVSSRKDKTIIIRLGTQELPPDKAGELFTLMNAFCYVYLKEDQAITEDEKDIIDGFESDLYDNKKSQAQRIRGVLYKNWELDNKGFKDFKDYYRAETEKIIEHYKSKL